MKHLLSREHAEVLVRFASSRLLLAFDFDGTLAPIVPDREQALMRPETAAALRTLAVIYPCAVISGRGQADVSARLAGAAIKYVVGNHGIEGGGHAVYEHELTEVRRSLAALLDSEQGVDLEDKEYSLAVHYRRSHDKRKARAAIVRAVMALPTAMRLVPGKLVVNVVPAGAPHKGDAVLDLRAREQADTAIYIGDDVTDEDVFKIDQPDRLLSVRIGESRASAAGYCLRDQREIDRLLAKLIELGQNRVRSI